MSEKPLVRLQKYIADCGVTSRRKAEDLIVQGHVKVNNLKVTQLGSKVNPIEDVVQVRDKIVDPQFVDRVYMVMNKPRSHMTTLSDPEGRKTIIDLIPMIKQRVYPVGRLDYHSEGLLILTNDGEFGNMVAHPSFELTKVYEVKVFGRVDDTLLSELRKGVYDKGEFLKPSSVRVIERLPHKTWLEFRLQEGKNREIRRICEKFGMTIDKLRRVAIEGLDIVGIKPGDFVFYTKRELLKKLGINEKGKKVGKQIKYISPKKTARSQKGIRRQKDSLPATDEKFHALRKERYSATMKSRKDKLQKEVLNNDQAE